MNNINLTRNCNGFTEEILKEYAAKDSRINTFNGRGYKLIPTLQEAFDIIEMEEIERDLGF